MLKKIAALVALLLSTSTPPILAQVDERAIVALDRIPTWRESVVILRIDCPGQKPSRGTGVVINERGYVLTAAHVGSGCLDVSDASVGKVTSLYAAPKEEFSATLMIRRVDGEDSPNLQDINTTNFEDLALWKISNFKATGLIPARKSSRFQAPSDPVIVVGFSGLPFSYPTSPHNQLAGLTVFSTSLSSVAGTESDVPYRLHYPGYTLSGVSGGPVFDSFGELIGIHSTRETTNIRDLISTNCTVDTFGNCAVINFLGPNEENIKQPIGVNFAAVKSVLDNYSWATSIHAVPDDWFEKD